MKKNLFTILILFILGNVSAQSNVIVNNLDASENQISAEQAALIFDKARVFPENTEVSIGFIKNGEVSYYGVKRANDSLNFSKNFNEIFEIGSITKLFTSTLLANFVLEKKIKLDDPVQKYFDFPIANKEITVLQLANHTSGLSKLPSNLDLDKADQANPYKDYNEAKLKQFLVGDFELLTTPGSTFEYSNIGTGILGYLLVTMAESNYEDLLQSYVLSKYDMKNTTTDRTKIAKKIVDGLDDNGVKTANWDLNSLVSTGGLLSNVEDLSKFAMAQLDHSNKELNLTRESTFDFSEYQMELGLAWKIIKPDDKLRWHAANGGTGGYSSMMAIDVTNKNGIIILSNVSTFNENARNIDHLCFGLMKSLYIE